MAMSFFDNLADSLCRNCPKRKAETGDTCMYLIDLGQHCTTYQKVLRSENELKVNIAHLVKFQNKIS